MPAATPPEPLLPVPAVAAPAVAQPAPPAPADPTRQAAALEAARLLDTARAQVEGYNYLAARQLAHRILTQPGVVEFDPTWMAAAELINRINTVFMSSETPSPERQAYSIKAGDSLSRIALGLETSVGALQRINGLDPTSPIIYPGAVLYSLKAAWSIRVVKSRFVLLLMNGPELYRLYHIGIGRANKTPAGNFLITSKVIHPAWTPPGKSFPYGHPENPLGTHWLGLSPTGDTDPTLRGFGIHGTWEPDSIGSATSEGCVRMLNEQVGELFDFIPEPGRGTPVQVVIED
ncbi:MAG: L,D-transpeptidase family protein [Lentisphaerae bacterium]|nr:L,D-transpeptidase family protein [Lentisphaerota bacterium]